jgi:hypothetical protein
MSKYKFIHPDKLEFEIFPKANFSDSDTLNEKDQNFCARWASRVRSGGFFGFKSGSPPHPSGYGRVEGSRHKLFFRPMRMYGSNGTDAAAQVVKGITNAGKAKGVFYDN